MTKILIDLKTIERNPDYAPGTRQYANKGPMRITFKCNGPLPESFKEYDNILINNNIIKNTENDSYYYEGTVIGELDIPALQKEIPVKDLTLHWEREVMEVSNLGDSEWYFKYEPTFVTCTECGSMFSHEYLESDEANRGDNYSSEVCPVCGEWDCCEVEYEDIRDALKRKAIAEAPSVEEFKQQAQDLIDFETYLIAKKYGVDKEDLK
jgi:hypothetical protein